MAVDDIAATQKTIFANNLKRLRLESKLKQNALADLFETDARTWRRWESPTDRHWPPAHQIPRLANVFNCSIDDLFDFEPTWLAQTAEERELLMIARQANPNLPRRQIINALVLVLGKLTGGDRKAWLDIGNRLAKK